MTLWTFLAFALDAIAIAAQAITGRYLGAGDLEVTRQATDRMVTWGWRSGLVTGARLAVTAPFVGQLFTSDPAVHAALWPVLLVAALFQPLAGIVFVLDGVLIGAGDGRYLAWAGTVVLVLFAPAAWAVTTLTSTGLLGLWVAFGVAFMGGRGAVLVHRARGTRWMVTGAPARL
jgi:Na+-driven multidrug efflux pump